MTAEKTDTIRKTDGIACPRGVDCFALAWTAGMLSAFLRYGLAAGGFGLMGALLLCLLLKSRRREIICAVLGLICGIAFWSCYDTTCRQPLLRMDGQTAELTGEITDITQYARDRTRISLRTRLCGTRTVLNWYTDGNPEQLRIGDSVTLSAGLTRIAPDYRRFTAESAQGRGEYLRCYDAAILGISRKDGFSLRRVLREYRAALTARIAEKLPDQADAGLLCAMLFGDKTALDESGRLSLYRTGIGHITAVSGLHLVFLCTLLTLLLRRLTAPPWGILAVNAAAVTLFALMTDSAVSVHRGIIMILLYYAAPLVGREIDPLRSLSLAMLLCTAFSPYVIGSVSFWLSVSGVFGVSIATPYLTNHCSAAGIRRRLLQMCAVSASVFPASFLLTGESSLIAPVCNLLLIPLGTGAVYIGLLTVCTGGLTAFLLPAAGALCRCMNVLAEAAARLPFSHIRSNAPSVRLTVVLCTVLLLILFAAQYPPRGIAAVFGCTALLLFGQMLLLRAADSRQMRTAVLGTEKDTALVVTADRRTVLADLSRSVKTPAYVRRYLRDNDITGIDLLILASPANAAAYQKELADCEVRAVRLLTGETWRSDAVICGCAAEFCEGQPVCAQAGDFSLTAAPEQTLLRYHGVTVCALPADAEEAVTADIVIRTGGDAPDPGDRAAVRILPAKDGAQILLTVTADGKYKRETL